MDDDRQGRERMSEYVFSTDKPIENFCYKCPLCQYLTHIGHICNLLKKNVEKIMYFDRPSDCPLVELPKHSVE